MARVKLIHSARAGLRISFVFETEEGISASWMSVLQNRKGISIVHPAMGRCLWQQTTLQLE